MQVARQLLHSPTTTRRNLVYRFLAIALTLGAVPVWASSISISASERGWVCGNGPNNNCPASGNDGAAPGNYYSAGAGSDSDNSNLAQVRDWFEFPIPSLTGTLVSATLSLDDGSHEGGDLTFDVYGLSAQPLVFTDVTTSNLFGSVSTSNSSAGTTLTISLNAAALAAIGAAQGGNIFIGGIDSAETITDPGTVSLGDFVGDFGSTANIPGFQSFNTDLNLTTTTAATVPEPSSLLLLASAALLLLTWRALQRAATGFSR